MLNQITPVAGLRKGDKTRTRLFNAARELLPPALWVLHLAILLYFVHDDSPGQERTRRLAEGAMALLAQLVTVVSTPLLQPILKPVRGRVLDLLREAKLLPDGRPELRQEG